VLENKVLRRIFGPKREEVAEGWRRLQNEELHNVYASTNIISMIKLRRMKWAGHLACMGEMRNAYKIFVRIPKVKSLLGKPNCMWEDNIRMDLGEIGWEVVYWIHLAEKRDQWQGLVNAVMKFHVP
jgi:hypothetical protein